MKPLIVFRRSVAEREEIASAQRAELETADSLASARPDETVVGRYSVLPFYTEHARAVELLGGTLVNSVAQHEYVADLTQWYDDLQDMTFETWFSVADAPKDAGPFVLKGHTNSMRHRWKTHMFAPDWESANKIEWELSNDMLLSGQKTCVRKFEPLVRLGEQVTGMAISEEHRFFVLDSEILCGGFYWALYEEDIRAAGFSVPSPTSVPREFLARAIERVGDKCRFYALDVARTAMNEWKVMELNDGQMSGLCGCDADALYTGISRKLTKQRTTLYDPIDDRCETCGRRTKDFMCKACIAREQMTRENR